MRTLDKIDVSRETIEKLEAFERLVQKWTPRINLIAKSTIHEIWDRHILDSAQLHQFAPANARHWLDIGSGGGFPGVIMAIMSAGKGYDTTFTFIESDQRKATFLRTAARELDLSVTVLAERIEQAPPQSADVVSARALKSLVELMPFLHHHMAQDGVAILPKGASYAEEIEAARTTWQFDLRDQASMTNKDARILILRDLASD